MCGASPAVSFAQCPAGRAAHFAAAAAVHELVPQLTLIPLLVAALQFNTIIALTGVIMYWR